MVKGRGRGNDKKKQNRDAPACPKNRQLIFCRFMSKKGEFGWWGKRHLSVLEKATSSPGRCSELALGSSCQCSIGGTESMLQKKRYRRLIIHTLK